MRKKKRDGAYYKDHTVAWAVERLSRIRDTVDEVFDNTILSAQEKEAIFCDYIKDVENLIELLDPFDHEYDSLIVWARGFIKEYDDTI